MAIAQGVFKQTRFKRQTAKGTIASGASGGQVIRRTSSTHELQKETYDTASEINSTQQLISVRHGVKLVAAAINGLLSPGTYSDMLSAVVRRDFAAVTAMTALSVTISGSGPTYTVARGSGSFLSDGVKVGMVVRLTAGSFNAANLNKNLWVTAVTALNLTVIPLNGVALFAEGPIASATVSVPGKVTYVPTTGHTNVYYTVEEWYPDVPYSERSQDVKYGQAQISLPGSGNATIALTGNGLDQSTSTTVYFSSPTTETTTEVGVAATGLLQVGGVTQAAITDLSFTINGNLKPADGTVGSNLRADIFTGKVMVTGQFTAYFDSSTISDAFINETDSSILSAVASGATAAADFMTFTMSKLNVNSSQPNDEETGLKRVYNFTAELNSAGGAGIQTEKTTIQIQDSQAA